MGEEAKPIYGQVLKLVRAKFPL